MSLAETVLSQDLQPLSRTRRILEAAAFAAVTLLILALAHHQSARFFWFPNTARVALPFAASLVAALIFSYVRYASFNPVLATTLRASAAGILIALLFESPDYTLANADTAAFSARFVQIGYWPALVAAVLSLFRPSFAVAAAVFVFSTRQVVQSISGLPMSFLDMRYMVDMTLYVGVFGIAIVALRPWFTSWLTAPEREWEVLGAAFGLHLANYFWSGIAKAVVGPAPWFWVFNNQTFDQMPYTLESGIHPLGGWPWLMQAAYDVFKVVCVPVNAGVFLAQLFAIVCVLRKSWLKWASVLYDVLHVGIFVFGGLFFWPWVWNNVTILLASKKVRGELATGTKVACITTIMLGAPFLHLNEAAWLGWLDINSGRQIFFSAVRSDGSEVKVPSAFFLSHSYSVSHGYMGFYPKTGHYDATMLGGTYDYERRLWDDECPAPARVTTGPTEEADDVRTERQAMLGRFLRAHHEKMKQREAVFGPYNYYLHLHHHPSNPMLYTGFSATKLADVVAYKLNIESGCYDLRDGGVAKKVWAKDYEYYDVR